ncbi:MAG: PEP-CTERM sorting domain-containing protein [Verrucomicrobiia bacterium]|jgi:T5SS/PEP-CTERM-associated repeat protein
MKTETRRWAGILFAAVGTLLSVVIRRSKLLPHTAALCLAAAVAIVAAPNALAESGVTNIIDGNTVNIAGNYMVGTNGSFNALIVTNAGVLNVTGDSIVGNSPLASNNLVSVTGSGSVWSSSGGLNINFAGNSMTIANNGFVSDSIGLIKSNASVMVTGSGSTWSNSSQLTLGVNSHNTSLVIADGAQVFAAWSLIGGGIIGATNNTVLVTGVGASWNLAEFLTISPIGAGTGNNLTITDNGTVKAPSVFVGASSLSLLTITNGNLYATNAASTGSLEARFGAITLNRGTIITDQLRLTNANSVMNFSAGLLRSGASSVSNGVAFAVGDGVQSATLDLLGGTHTFADGLMLSTNSSLIGSGNIIGSVTNFSIIAPGHSVGTINITGDLTLADSSWLDMELAGPGTNDVLDISGLLAAGGGLKLTLTNGYTGNAGDTFDLFNFGSISGAFSQTNLPTLAAGMEWNTGHLYTLGEIRIVPEPGTWALTLAGAGALWLRRRRR